MPELPANSIALAEHYLRLMFADGATFRTWTGTASQAAALEHLYRQALPEPGAGAARYTAAELDGYRPFVITYVGVEEGYRFDRAGIGAANEFDDSGTLFCQLEQTVDPGLTAQDGRDQLAELSRGPAGRPEGARGAGRVSEYHERGSCTSTGGRRPTRCRTRATLCTR